ncbi:uncharacterized protein LY89DRAFT_716459 [Mollisia scopiformis]|uniref:Zn(2)-C6 fungal-type domain-containing protein n=1 Tax=Mollisia scopiformis TaxID=149040 RepID=A0A194XIP8_MOLSC|nr:uncharacterized protein LY89DRAFT_716459 [Mollisia scopiformis]KUJ19994.1 hypothetical protein LY89DRAFT_716459 [Mollisia scopiformis]
MDTDEMQAEVSPNKQTPKLRRSCETCRSSKGRCLPSDNDPNRCQKCLKDGKNCIFLEAKPRPKRAKNSRIRVAEMEEKLEGLLSLLAAQAGTTGTSAVQPDTSSAPARPDTSSASAGSLTPASTRDQTDLTLFNETNPTVFPSNFNFPVSSPQPQISQSLSSTDQSIYSVINSRHDKIQDVISKGIVNFVQAEQALRLFQANCSSFPFIIVPEGMSVDALRRHRPFLLLSILTFASSGDEKVQAKLEREMRENLSRRLIVNGERSLDLLEGLLVYIAWYHFYFDPENQQLYQLCQMATSLAADININKPPRSLGNALQKFSIAKPSSFLSGMAAEDAESKRVYLGCYYISSSICHGLRKPNNMKYSSYMEECAQALSQSGQAETDRLLPYFIQLQRLSQEVSETFDYAANFELPPLDAGRISVLSKAFEQQLNQIESSISSEAWNNDFEVQLTMQLHVTRIHINEVGFHAAALPQDQMLYPQIRSKSWYYSSARSESLMRCLQACKDFLDHFLSLPSEGIINSTLPDMLGLVYTVLVLGTFAVRIDTPTLDAVQLREMANYDYYISALINKTEHVMAFSGPAGANDYMHHIHVLFLQTKVWYSQVSSDPSVFSTIPEIARPGFSFMDILSTIVDRCVDFSAATISNSTTSDEQWTELLSEWSGALEQSTIPMEGTMEEF